MVTVHRKIGKGCLYRERSGNWSMQLMVDGVTIYRCSGSKNRAEAKAMLGELVREQEELRKARESSMRILCEWNELEQILKASGVGNAGIVSRKIWWRDFAEWMHEFHREVADYKGVTEGMAAEYMRFIQGRNSVSSRNNRLYALRGMFNALHGNGEWENPWNGFRWIPARSHSRRALSRDEIGRLLAVAATEGEEWRVLFLLGVNTGQGLRGCCSLTWSQISLEGRTVRISSPDGKSHVVGINDGLYDALSRMYVPGRRGLVLPNVSEMHSRKSLEIVKTLARIFDKAGIETSVRIEGSKRRSPDASFLSLRCSFIEHAAKNGVPLADVKAIVGSSGSFVGRLYRNAIGVARKCESPRESSADVYASIASRLAEMGELLRLGLISKREYEKTCGRICREER